jgi:UDP-3-O-[3-hydroxymyristoyl] glucosamine N-acyltransferase
MATTIHPTAEVAPGAELGEGVTVGAGAIVGPAARIGSGTFIGPRCVVGEPTRDYYDAPERWQPTPTVIGPHSLLRTGTILYAGVTVGEHFQTGPYVVVREKTRFGQNCSLGNNCDVQADVVVGDYTRCHSNVTLGQYSVVGSYCWFMPYVLLMNDTYPPNFHDPRGCQVGDFTVLGGRVVCLPITIGKHVVAAAQAVLARDVEDFSLVRGNPAERVGDCRHLVATRADGRKYHPYPWPRHRGAGYPFTPELLAALDAQTTSKAGSG